MQHRHYTVKICHCLHHDVGGAWRKCEQGTQIVIISMTRRPAGQVRCARRLSIPPPPMRRNRQIMSLDVAHMAAWPCPVRTTGSAPPRRESTMYSPQGMAHASRRDRIGRPQQRRGCHHQRCPGGQRLEPGCHPGPKSGQRERLLPVRWPRRAVWCINFSPTTQQESEVGEVGLGGKCRRRRRR
jgi:hypothetical protein